MQGVNGNIFESNEKFRNAFDAHFTPPVDGEAVAYEVYACRALVPCTDKIYGKIFVPIEPNREVRGSNYFPTDYHNCTHGLPGKHIFKVGSDFGYFSLKDDKTCGVYHAIETIRQAIFTTIKEQKNSVEIPWYADHDKYVYVFQDTEQSQKELEATQLIERGVNPEIFQNDSISPEVPSRRFHCTCKTGVPFLYWKNFVLPTIIKIVKSSGCEVSVIKLNERQINIGSTPSDTTFKQCALDAIKVSWKPDMIPNYPLPGPKALPPPPKPTASVVGSLITASYEQGEGCDFEFVCWDGSCKAHKLVLMLSSPFFKTMLGTKDTPMKEILEGKLNAQEFSVATIKALLEYIYKGINPFDQPDVKVNAFEIFTLSHRWSLPLLVDIAANEIGEVCVAEEWRDIGELGALTENVHLLKIYNSFRHRMRPLPEPPVHIKNAMLKLGLIERNNA